MKKEERKKLNRMRKNHSWGQFFFSFKKCDQRTEFYMQLFPWRLYQQNFCPDNVTALASALHSTAQACVCELEPSPVPLTTRMTTWLLGTAIVYSYCNWTTGKHVSMQGKWWSSSYTTATTEQHTKKPHKFNLVVPSTTFQVFRSKQV